jgi:hypothetical protein
MNFIKRFVTFYQKQDSVIFWSTSISIIIALVLTLFYLFYFDNLPRQIPFFFSMPWGESQLANKNQFFILPSLIVLSALINLTVTWHLHTSQLTMKRILTSSTMFVSLLIFYAGVKIVFTTL